MAGAAHRALRLNPTAVWNIFAAGDQAAGQGGPLLAKHERRRRGRPALAACAGAGKAPAKLKVRGGFAVAVLLRLSRLIDVLNEKVGQGVYWLVLVAVLVSSGNAMVRYIFSTSSNAWLEIQWYLFAAIFLLCAGYTLQRNEHVRIDIVASRFSRRTQTWIDVFGFVCFLMPMALIIMWLSVPVFLDSYWRNEMSGDAGGLIRWPAKLIIPVGFLLLVLQGISELIKRIAFLMGLIPDPVDKQAAHGVTPEVEHV
jgi:TRAP-type mannitol/chloroaromatic compound transport system permease small subunit